MPEPGTSEKRASILRSISGTLKLYGLITLIVEAGLLAVVLRTDSYTRMVALIGMIVILLLVVCFAGLNWESLRGNASGSAGDATGRREELAPLWGQYHLPLAPVHVNVCEGTWRCQWWRRNEKGEIQPYVDDTIHVKSVAPQTGNLEGRGEPVYKRIEAYKIRGRVSKHGFAHLYYSTPPPQEKLAGLVILKFDFREDVAKGWWLGRDPKDTREIGGPVTWTKAGKWKGEWQNRHHEDQTACDVSSHRGQPEDPPGFGVDVGQTPEP